MTHPKSPTELQSEGLSAYREAMKEGAPQPVEARVDLDQLEAVAKAGILAETYDAVRDWGADNTAETVLALIAETRKLRAAVEGLSQVIVHPAAQNWVHSSVRKPKPGDSICFIWGDRGIAGTVQRNGQLHRWSSAYPVDDAEEYMWCLLPGIPEWPSPPKPPEGAK